MRAVAWFLSVFAVALLAIILVGVPVWHFVSNFIDAPFHRVSNRLAMLVMIIGFIFVIRRLGVGDRASLGYGLPRRQFLRETGLALLIGIASMLPVIAALVALGIRVPAEIPGGASAWLAIVAGALLSGLVVALLEETLLRGAMYSGIARESGATLAIAVTSILYSASHFLGRYRIPAEQVNSGSGLDLVKGAFGTFGDPLFILDAFLCLAAVGVLLALVRRFTGNIAACIGLHAGWVFVIGIARELTDRDADSTLIHLVSDYDGVVGWLVLGWIAIIGWPLLRFYERRGAAAAPRTTPG